MASQPFQQCLQHTQFEIFSSLESNFGESTNSTAVYKIHIFANQVSWRVSWLGLAIQPIQPQDVSSMFSIVSLNEIVGKEWYVNHFNSVLDTHNLKIGVRENLIMANQPIQPLFTTHIFS
jgi:hypothetical protein